MIKKIAWNKNTKGLCKSNKTSFKKGQIPWNKGLHIQTNTGRTHFKKGFIPTNKKDRIQRKCLYCKKYFICKFDSERKFCSHKCYEIYEKGKHLSETTEFKRGITPWNKGKSGMFLGDKNPNWQGGISFEPYSIDWTKTLRISIRERDHYRCQLCGEPQGDRALHIHHIDYDKQNCNPENLITLCNSCHIKTNYNRKYWIKYFNKIKK